MIVLNIANPFWPEAVRGIEDAAHRGGLRESCGYELRRDEVRVMARTYDVLTMGRSSIDLYAHQIGVPMTDVTSFDAYVGGCPTNISVGTDASDCAPSS